MDKINALELYEDMTEDYSERVLPRLRGMSINVYKLLVPQITHLYDKKYWQAINVDADKTFFLPDYRHWLFSDQDYKEYCKRLCSLQLRYLCIFDAPYDYERPWNIDIEIFESKLYERARILAEMAKNKHGPRLTVIAPCIGPIFHEYRERYLRFLLQSRHLFDVYSMHYCHDMDDKKIGFSMSLLQEVIRTERKPVYVTRWAMPCGDEEPENRKGFTQEEWKLLDQKMASRKLEESVVAVDSVTKDKTHWFFTGLTKDLYHPSVTPGPGDFWLEPQRLPQFFIKSHCWEWYHFLGCLDYKEHFKDVVFNTVLSLAARHNNPVARIPNVR